MHEKKVNIVWGRGWRVMCLRGGVFYIGGRGKRGAVIYCGVFVCVFFFGGGKGNLE